MFNRNDYEEKTVTIDNWRMMRYYKVIKGNIPSAREPLTATKLEYSRKRELLKKDSGKEEHL